MHAETRLQVLPARLQGGLVLAAVAAIVAIVMATHAQTTASLIAIYERNETFAHGFVILPIFLYLLWRKRDALALMTPQPYWPALAGLALAAAVGWVGARVNAVSVTQFAMVALVPFGVWALLGTRIARELAFPLLFLFFAVPFGEFLVPYMIDWTADFTVLAIRASGVPILREGNMFTIPTGRWSVVEACSGLRYLIASVLVGVLFAYLSYRSTKRRAAFIAASFIVPIIANWLRAYMIVMLGHFSDNRLAVGVDHLIYGWIFFGVVMLILFAVGARWREDRDPPVPASDAGTQVRLASHAPPRSVWPMAAAVVLVIGVSAYLQTDTRAEAQGGAATLARLQGAGGWSAVDEPLSSWRPDVVRASTELRETFARGDARVATHIALFREQTRSAKAIASTNQVVEPMNPKWVRAESHSVTARSDAGDFRVSAGVVSGAGDRLAFWQWFWVDGRFVQTRYEAALYQVLATLRGRDDSVAWVIVYTPTASSEASVRAALADFTQAMERPIRDALRQAAGAP